MALTEREAVVVLLAGVTAATAPDLGRGDLSTITGAATVAGIMETGSHGNRIPAWLKCCTSSHGGRGAASMLICNLYRVIYHRAWARLRSSTLSRRKAAW